MGRPAVYHLGRLRLMMPALMGAVLLVACGPSPTLTLQLGDTTIQVIAGGTGSTEATITRGGGASADVTLDATGAPDWVTVSFAPATLVGGDSESVMTITTDGEDPAIQATSFTLTVTAVGGGLMASEEVMVQVDLLVVRGTLVDIFHRPVTGASVSVDGSTPVAVDAGGVFEVPDVVIPYDLVVLEVANDWAHVYQGLTATDLTPMTTNGVGSASSANVSGDLSAPVGANQLGFVCVEGIDKVVVGTCDTVGVGETAYSVNPGWFEGTAAEVHVRAWVVDMGAGGEATGYPFQGQTALNLTDGMVALADVALEEGPNSVEIDFDVTPPPGMPLGTVMVLYAYGENSTVAFPLGTPSDSFTAVLPDYPGASVALVGAASSTAALVYAWETTELSDGVVDLVMPEPATQVAPANAATDVNLSTTFRVDNPSGTPPTFLFSGPTTFLVTTSGNETTLPDLSTIGMPLPAVADYSWQVLGSTHLASVDAVAYGGWYPIGDLQLMVTGGPALPSGSIQIANPRTFTTE